MSKGTTLIEIIVGIAIISIGVLFIVLAFPLGLASVNTNQQSNVALFLASSKIEEISSQFYDEIEKGVIVEEFNEISDFKNYKREVVVECFDINNDNCSGGDSGIKKVTVTVSFVSVTEKNITLTTLITKK